MLRPTIFFNTILLISFFIFQHQKTKQTTEMKTLCFIDIETTGTVFGFHEIIEIAAVKTSFSGKEVACKWEKRFQPKHPKRITDTAKKINNYRADTWINSKPHSHEIWQEAKKFWKNCIPVCHNPSFERAFITLALLDAGIKEIGMDYHWIGTESLAWPLYIKGKLSNLSLSSLANHFNLKAEPFPHTAMNGAFLCRAVYLKLLKN